MTERESIIAFLKRKRNSIDRAKSHHRKNGNVESAERMRDRGEVVKSIIKELQDQEDRK